MYTEDLLEQLRGKSIAVIGNAVFRYPFGKFIDQHDVVLRMNGFVLDGYAEYCGAKITHWCTHGSVIYNPHPTAHREGLQPFSPFLSEAAESMDIIPEFRARMLFARQNYQRDRFPKPSTGTVLLLMLEAMGISVDVFGFDGFRSGHYYRPEHQHDPNHKPNEFEYMVVNPTHSIYVADMDPVTRIRDLPTKHTPTQRLNGNQYRYPEHPQRPLSQTCVKTSAGVHLGTRSDLLTEQAPAAKVASTETSEDTVVNHPFAELAPTSEQQAPASTQTPSQKPGEPMEKVNTSSSDYKSLAWALADRALSEEECDRAIALAYKYDRGQAEVVGDVVDHRLSYVHKIFLDEDSAWLYEIVVKVAQKENALHYGFDLDKIERPFEYVEYEPGFGRFKWHDDYSHEGEEAPRKLTVIFQLSDPDDYEGGELQMFGVPIATLPKKRGSILVFPAFVPHCVTPVTKGLRKAMVTWIGGPRLR